MRIIEEVGDTDVEVCDGGVLITQLSTCGDQPASVFIPLAMIDLTCQALRTQAQVAHEVENNGG